MYDTPKREGGGTDQIRTEWDEPERNWRPPKLLVSIVKASGTGTDPNCVSSVEVSGPGSCQSVCV